jgi:hypothetical protein
MEELHAPSRALPPVRELREESVPSAERCSLPDRRLLPGSVDGLSAGGCSVSAVESEPEFVDSVFNIVVGESFCLSGEEDETAAKMPLTTNPPKILTAPYVTKSGRETPSSQTCWGTDPIAATSPPRIYRVIWEPLVNAYLLLRNTVSHRNRRPRSVHEDDRRSR